MLVSAVAEILFSLQCKCSFVQTHFGNILHLYGSMMTYLTPLSSKKPFIGKTIDSNLNYLKILYYVDFVSGAHRGFKAEFSSDRPQGK